MNITIVGSGHVGRALGAGWRKGGHSVTFATRELAADKAATLRHEGFGVAPLTAAGADVIVLAIPWMAVEATLYALGPLAGKVLIDCTDPLKSRRELAIGFDDSGGETVARLTGARVVKAFSTTGAANMADSHYPGGQAHDGGRGRRRGGEADRDVACGRTRLRAGGYRPAHDVPLSRAARDDLDQPRLHAGARTGHRVCAAAAVKPLHHPSPLYIRGRDPSQNTSGRFGRGSCARKRCF